MGNDSTLESCKLLVDLDSPDNSRNAELSLEVLQQKIDCQLDYFTETFSPFISLVQFLLSYGTAFIVAIGVATNVLCFIVLTRKNMRRSSSNMFLSILAVYDTLSLTMNFMIGVIRGQNTDANQSFMDSQALCRLHGMFVVVFNLWSVWIIVAFSVVRFLIVKFPLKAKNFTTFRTFLIISTVAVFVFIFSCHKLFITGFEGDSVFGYKGCKTDRLQIPGIGKFYVAFNTWLPTLLILCFNLAIIREIRIYGTKRLKMTNNSSSKSEEKSTRLLLRVSFIYLGLILPLGVVQTIELFWNGTVNSTAMSDPHYVDYRIVKIKLKWVRAFFFFFYQINFGMNFFLYMLSSSGKAFQKAFKDLLGIKTNDPATDTQNTMTTAASNAVAPAPATKPRETTGNLNRNAEANREADARNETDANNEADANRDDGNQEGIGS